MRADRADVEGEVRRILQEVLDDYWPDADIKAVEYRYGRWSDEARRVKVGKSAVVDIAASRIGAALTNAGAGNIPNREGRK